MLLNNKMEAFTKKDFGKLEKYVRSTQPVIISGEFSINPKLSCKNNVCCANLEKLLVDLVCDEKIYGQYQGQELENIYQNSMAKYAVNYSQILKYAAARKRKTDVEALLLTTEEYKKVRDLL